MGFRALQYSVNLHIVIDVENTKENYSPVIASTVVHEKQFASSQQVGENQDF